MSDDAGNPAKQVFLRKNDTQAPTDTDHPFHDDAFGDREQCADNLTRMLQGIQQPFVLSINAPWGGGKTFFIKRWRQALHNEGFFTLYHNAWEDDFSANPLLSFVGELHEQLNAEHSVLGNNDQKTLAKKAMNAAGELAALGIYGTAEFVTSGAFGKAIQHLDNAQTENDIHEKAAQLRDSALWEHIAIKRAVNECKDSLSSLAESLPARPLVFFVDELDRCRPSYAVSFLEHIKHIFSAPKVVFILGVAKTQLVGAVQGVFGGGIDGEKYLRRFIDLDFNIPRPNTDRFCEQLWKELGYDSLFSPNTEIKEAVLGTGSVMSHHYCLDLRTIEQCFIRIRAVQAGYRADAFLWHVFTVVMLFVRFGDRVLYDRIIGQSGSPKELINALWPILPKEELEDKTRSARVIAAAAGAFADHPDIEENIQNWKETAERAKTERDRDAREIEILDALDHLWARQRRTHCRRFREDALKALEFADRFET